LYNRLKSWGGIISNLQLYLHLAILLQPQQVFDFYILKYNQLSRVLNTDHRLELPVSKKYSQKILDPSTAPQPTSLTLDQHIQLKFLLHSY